DTDTAASPQVISPAHSVKALFETRGSSILDTVELPSTSANKAGTLFATPSQSSPVDDFYESQTIDSSTAKNIYAPNWVVTNNAGIDNYATCRNFLDHVTPRGYWAALHNQGDAGFLDAFNINSAQHICMASELRLRYEHEIMTMEKFERKFTDSAAVVQQRDAEVVDLRDKLEKAEGEAAEVVELRDRVSELDAGLAAKSKEVVDLNGKNSKLLGKVSNLELTHRELSAQVSKLIADCEVLRSKVAGEAILREEFKSFQDTEACRFEQKSAELDARITDVKRDMNNDLYPHMFTAIAGRRSALSKVISLAINKGIQEGLEAGITYGKSGQTLAQVEAYNPRVKDEFVVAVTNFENVSFALLDELESLKDSPLASIMSALVLRDAQGNVDSTPELQRFQPSLDQVTVPIYSESGSVSHEMPLFEVVPTARAAADRRGLCSPLLGGASSSAPPHESSMGVSDYQVSTLALSGDGGSANQPPVVQPHDDLFDTSILDGSGGT
ncbi:hypothetical protein Tco_1324528, partial [Tanacetum coccineum]